VPYEEYVLSYNEPITIGHKIKDFRDVVRFDDFFLRATLHEGIFVPEIEITKGVPVSAENVDRPVFNRLAINPQKHKIAFLDVYSPQLVRLS
jgi:hypothetical protein